MVERREITQQTTGECLNGAMLFTHCEIQGIPEEGAGYRNWHFKFYFLEAFSPFSCFREILRAQTLFHGKPLSTEVPNERSISD